MSLFAVYLCRVPLDNDRQWSCYLMISNRFVHVKWGKSDNFWLRKRNDSDHIHTLWETDGRRGHGEDGRRGRTERTDGRSAPGGASLATFHVWGVLINWFPTFYFLSLWKMHLFSFLSKKHVLAMFQPCSVNNRFYRGFRHCSRFVPVFLCPRLVSQRPVWPCMLNKTKTKTMVKKCVRVPPVLCAVAASNGDERSVCLIGRTSLFYRQHPNAIST